MSILWCGGEDIDFPTGGAPTISTAIGNFRAGYARCGIAENASTGVISVPFPGGPVTSLWLSCQMYLASSVSSYLHGISGPIAWPTGLYFYCSGNKAQFYKYDGGGTMLAQESGLSLNSPAMYKIDIQIINYGSSSIVNVYINGILVITYSGSTSLTGVSGLDRITFGNTLTSQPWFSEFIVADEDTRQMFLVTLAPNAAGTTAQWTGVYTNVNPTIINDANVDYTNAINQDQQYNLMDLPAENFSSVKAVKAAVRAMVTTGATATGIKIGVNSGGTVNIDSGRTLTTSFTTYERMMLTNPVTSSAWTQFDVNSLQINMRSQ